MNSDCINFCFFFELAKNCDRKLFYLLSQKRYNIEIFEKQAKRVYEKRQKSTLAKEHVNNFLTRVN